MHSDNCILWIMVFFLLLLLLLRELEVESLTCLLGSQGVAVGRYSDPGTQSTRAIASLSEGIGLLDRFCRLLFKFPLLYFLFDGKTPKMCLRKVFINLISIKISS